ncbi:glycosyltransferase family 25 protein [Pantoea agglomerans]|uniref:glycosyltransferase family 25 protein n=1 Tax=Pantoea TaxID=53335 RepID=UPI00045C73E4|nr:glycosyltransferase family 25 protein [Pantoea agglomerans]KDA93402.1 glycosyl transferase family 25 [Pantoea agglomerans Eh318]
MMKAFIINLDSSTDRRATIAAQCLTAGIHYEFIRAVNGKQLSDEERAQHTRPLNYAFKAGEIGCALSHLSIYRKIVDEKIPQALILEDDALLTDHLPAVLSCPALKLDACNPTLVLLSRVNKYVNSVVAPVTDSASLYPVYSATTSHAYVINLEAAKRLLALLYPVWMAADKWCLFEEYGAFRLLAVHPAPVLLHEVAQQTTIQQINDVEKHDQQKREIWARLMAQRPLRVRIRQRYRRAVVPLLHEIVDVKATLE